MGFYIKHNDVSFQVGDTIKVHQSIVEGGKKRTQTFEGLVMRSKGDKGEKMFTVRKISEGLGVEKIYPIDCPSIQKIEVISKGKVKRAVLSYLRARTGRLALKVKTDYSNSQKNVKKPAKKEDDKKVKSATTKVVKPKAKTGKAGGTTGPKTTSK